MTVKLRTIFILIIFCFSLGKNLAQEEEEMTFS
jgi:hypothetical protein